MRLSRWWLVAILLVGFRLWVHDLDGMSLWRDEGLSVMRARQPVSQLLRNVNVISGIESPDLHPPGYFLALKGWTALLGESEVVLRLFSVFGMMVAAALVGRRVGVWAAVLLVVSPFAFWYAREARMYAWVAAGSSVLMMSDRWRGRMRWMGRVFGVLGLIGVHYASLFLVVAWGVVWAAERQWWSGRKGGLLGWSVAGLAGVACLVAIFWESVRAVLGGRFEHFEVRPVSQLLLEPIRTFALGDYWPPVLHWGWFVPFALVAAVGAVVARRWAAVLLLTVLLAWLSGLIVPNYTNPRHLTVLLPLWIGVLAVGLAQLGRWRWWLGVLGAAGLLAAALPTLVMVVSEPHVIKDDVRGAIRAIDRSFDAEHDVLVVHDAMLEPLVTYYIADDVVWRTLPWWGQHDVAEMRTVTEAFTQDAETVWMLDVAGQESGVKEWLDAARWRDDVRYFDGTGQTVMVRPYGRWANGEPGGRLAVDWAGDRFGAGQWVIGDVISEAAGELAIRLVNDEGMVAEATVVSEGGRAAFELPVSFDAAGVHVLEVQQAGAWVVLGQTTVDQLVRLTAVPTDAAELADVVWQPGMTLVGYAVDTVADGVRVRLYWEGQVVAGDWRVFVHVGVPGQPPVAQVNGVPAGNGRPVSSWRLDELIEDVHVIAVDDAAGLTVQVGWFDAADPAQRAVLLGDDNGDQLYELETIRD